MPPRTKRAKAEPETTELPFGKYVDKEPTEVHEACADWIQDNTGYDVDLKTVQLVALLYGRFQRSEENQERIKAQKANAAKLAEERANRPKAAKKTAAPTRRRGAAVEEDDEVEEEAPAKGRRGAGRATAVSPAKKATSRRRRPTAVEEDEDFDE
jgi:hypothetical protein